jgi:SAM-dependent methyltransferase
MDKMYPILSLKDHCFFLGPKSPTSISGLPTALPFNLGIHPRYAIPRLIMDDKISSALDRAYAVGSMLSTPLGDSPLAISRMNEIIDGLTSVLGRTLESSSLLEIGAGAGGLMSALRDRGAEVAGVEIGPQGKVAAQKYGLRIIDQPFAPGIFNERFDVIYSYGCLEHLSDLDIFFSACRSSLKEGGLIFHVVPNSALHFESGSLDHLAHEHINYFTAENGIRLFEAQGFSPAGASFTPAGNELMLWGVLNSSYTPHWPTDASTHEAELLDYYAKRLSDRRLSIQRHLEKLFDSNESVGFYAGGYEYGFCMQKHEIRYFDGDIYNHGKTWLAGLPPIESPEALKHSPVDHIVVFKPHYFNVIAERLRALNIGDTRIWNIASFYDND